MYVLTFLYNMICKDIPSMETSFMLLELTCLLDLNKVYHTIRLGLFIPNEDPRLLTTVFSVLC